MNWVILCLIVAFIYSIVAFIDNYIADVIFKDKHPQAVKVFNIAFYGSTALFLALVFGLKSIPTTVALIAFASGAIHSLSSIPYYLSLKHEEATTATTYFQLVPVLCFFADIFLLHKTVTGQQILAFVIILLAPVAILFAQRNRNKKVNKGKLQSDIWLLIYVVIASISTVIFSHISNDGHDSWTMLFWYVLGRFAFDLISTTIMPSWRRHVKNILKKNKFKTIAIIYGNCLIYTVGDFIFRYTLSLTNSSFASAVTNASELIITFALGIILTLIWPKFGREKLSKRTIASRLVAVVLVVISIILIQ